jgi:phosphate/sulfate permease
MRIKRAVRSTSTFLTQLGAAVVKTVITSIVLGFVVVAVMQYMGVPVPTAHELLGGVKRLAEILS